jgi:hypothetical protein
MLHGAAQYFITDVSGQRFGPIFKAQEEDFFLGCVDASDSGVL